MRAPRKASAVLRPCRWRSRTACALSSGSSAQKQLPSPGVLATPTTPPISSASWRQMLRPRPVPPYWRVVELSACENGWNRRGSSSAATPGPVSVTSKRTLPSPAVLTVTSIIPRSVNFSALLV